MPRKEPMKLGEFWYLIPEEQMVILMFDELEVIGTQEAISCIANSDVNGMDVVNVRSEDGYLKVQVKDYGEC